MRLSIILTASLSTLSLGLVQTAFADATDNLAVTADVQASCVITGNTLAFGTYDTVAGAPVETTAAISVACTQGTETTITLGQGVNAGPGSLPEVPARRLTDGAAFLSYMLYSDEGRTVPWGNTVASGSPYTALTSAPQPQTVFGRILGGQDVPAGAYTDTVVATIAF